MSDRRPMVCFFTVAFRVAAVLVAVAALVPTARCVQVEATADCTSARVGDVVTITIEARRADPVSEPPPVHALLNHGPEWEDAGQIIESGAGDDAAAVKRWRFRLRAVQPGPTQLQPVVVTLSEFDPSGAGVAVNGAPLALEILPARGHRLWLLAIVAAAVFGGAMYIVAVARRRRHRLPPGPPADPLAEALALLGETRADCRVDRAPRFLADVNDILRGYLARRLGKPLGAATIGEILDWTGRSLGNQEVLAPLGDLLRRCEAARLAGLRLTYEDLQVIHQSACDTLERLERAWVKDHPKPTGEAGTER